MRAARLLLWLLLSADAVFVALHVWAAWARPAWPLFSIESDNGYAELFQYLKFLWIALLLGALTRRAGAACLAWALLFAWLLVDDALALHERLGLALARELQIPPALGLRSQDFGELLVSGSAAGVLLAVLLPAWRRSTAAVQRLSRDLFALLLLLALFGIGFDLLHSLFRAVGPLNFALGTMEDGGEMVVASLLLARVFRESASLPGEETAAGKS